MAGPGTPVTDWTPDWWLTQDDIEPVAQVRKLIRDRAISASERSMHADFYRQSTLLGGFDSRITAHNQVCRALPFVQPWIYKPILRALGEFRGAIATPDRHIHFFRAILDIPLLLYFIREIIKEALHLCFDYSICGFGLRVRYPEGEYLSRLCQV